MKISLDIRKSVEENASVFFEKSKKAKKKLKGALEALEISKKKLKTVEDEKVEIKELNIKKVVKREWFEKFRWFVSSDGLLVIGGRDATTNEIVVKKYTDTDDLVFHTDMAGSPFVVIKSEGGKISELTIQEATNFTAVYSRAWRQGMTSLDVFNVNPDQVTKEANSGEFMTKGSFMIRGKTNYVIPQMNLAVGIHEDKVMGGPVSAIKKNCKEFVEVVQGKEKASTIAKIIKKKIGGDLDDIIRVLPAGGCEIKKN
jgi:predicted ribosome quality control (RQC) complex YloA/Tae2 family protein